MANEPRRSRVKRPVTSGARLVASTSCIDAAIYQMEKSYREGGLPIGSALSRGDVVLALGHNLRVQQGNPIAHGEMTCLANAGRLKSYRGLTLYTTLSPCMMCSGTIVQFKVPHVVVLDVTNFAGNLDYLRQNGVQVDVAEESRAVDLMRRFIAENPELWNEDIAE